MRNCAACGVIKLHNLCERREKMTEEIKTAMAIISAYGNINHPCVHNRWIEIVNHPNFHNFKLESIISAEWAEEGEEVVMITLQKPHIADSNYIFIVAFRDRFVKILYEGSDGEKASSEWLSYAADDLP